MTAAALVCLEPEIGSHGDVTSLLRYSIIMSKYLRTFYADAKYFCTCFKSSTVSIRFDYTFIMIINSYIRRILTCIPLMVVCNV